MLHSAPCIRQKSVPLRKSGLTDSSPEILPVLLLSESGFVFVLLGFPTLYDILEDEKDAIEQFTSS
jgi:hypothetical protein